MEDTAAAGAWPERENKNAARVAEIVDYVKQVSSNAAFLARAKMNKRISTRVTGKMSNLSPLLSMNLSMKDGKPTKVSELANPKSYRLEDLPPLDSKYNSGRGGFHKAINNQILDEGLDYNQITSLEQRLDQPEFQPQSTTDLYPRRLTMGSKRSIRCKKCEHNLLKPEYSPTSIKFKIHLCASSFIPDVRIFSLPDWSKSAPHKGCSSH